MKKFEVTVIDSNGSVVTVFFNVVSVTPCQQDGTLFYKLTGESDKGVQFLRGCVPGNLIIKTDLKGEDVDAK